MKNIKIDFPISGTRISIPFQAICSITNKEFDGNVIIEYYPNEKVLEFVSAEQEVQNFVKKPLTVEGLTNRIFKNVKKSIRPKYLKVLVDVERSKAHQPVQVWIEKQTCF